MTHLTDNPEQLRDLRGLGPASERMLIDAGIESPAALRRLGAVRAYLRVEQASGQTASLNLLYALEGAVQNRDWRDIAAGERSRLALELDAASGPSASER